MHPFDRQTDGRTDRQTDRIPIAIPRLHSMQRGKNVSSSRRKDDCDSAGRASPGKPRVQCNLIEQEREIIEVIMHNVTFCRLYET